MISNLPVTRHPCGEFKRNGHFGNGDYKMAEEQQFTQIDNWWSRNGETEIDIIAINELTKQAVFCEVKRQSKELDPSSLETHTSEFLIATRQLKKYTISHQGLSMQDM